MIGGLAASQHGIVARRQLLELGVGRRSIDHRLASGVLVRVFPGAYAVGHLALRPAGHASAGVAAAGLGTSASHWSAAGLYELVRPRQVVHVTSPVARRSPRGLFIHRAVLPEADRAVVDDVPVTSVARLALDLSAERDQRMLRTLIKRAEFKGLVTASEIVDVLQRYPRRRGRGTLARIAASYALTAGRTQSPLEDDFLEFCGVRDVPLPETNVPIAAGGRTYVVDCVWREARVIVELDGRDAHARELAFEDDRARDRALIAAGWRPIRVTSAQLRRGADALEHDVRAVLGLRR